MTQPAQQPEWSGIPYIVGDHTHVMPLYEDDRIHDILNGGDCHCKPDKIGQTFGERQQEPPKTVWQHRPTLPGTKQ